MQVQEEVQVGAGITLVGTVSVFHTSSVEGGLCNRCFWGALCAGAGVAGGYGRCCEAREEVVLVPELES